MQNDTATKGLKLPPVSQTIKGYYCVIWDYEEQKFHFAFPDFQESAKQQAFTFARHLEENLNKKDVKITLTKKEFIKR
jgi:hypothetical protein